MSRKKRFQKINHKREKSYFAPKNRSLQSGTLTQGHLRGRSLLPEGRAYLQPPNSSTHSAPWARRCEMRHAVPKRVSLVCLNVEWYLFTLWSNCLLSLYSKFVRSHLASRILRVISEFSYHRFKSIFFQWKLYLGCLLKSPSESNLSLILELTQRGWLYTREQF